VKISEICNDRIHDRCHNVFASEFSPHELISEKKMSFRIFKTQKNLPIKKIYTMEAALLETWLFKVWLSVSTVADVGRTLDTVFDALKVLYILSSCRLGVSCSVRVPKQYNACQLPGPQHFQEQ
jgi:hypothetical protein